MIEDNIHKSKGGIEAGLVAQLKDKGVARYSFVDVSSLPKNQNKNYPHAILIGKVLSQKYLHELTKMPDYVDLMIRSGKVKDDEFATTEWTTDRIADDIATFLKKEGYSAYSQSEENISRTGYYDLENKCTPLPHKTIARLAGWGWIGKHNLLVTREFGSAISMCTVLTDAPLRAEKLSPPESLCNGCSVCKGFCTPGAIKGNHWSEKRLRDNLVDVAKCTTCLKCLVFCPFTHSYMRKTGTPV